MAKLKATIEGRVRGSYGKPWSKLTNIPVTPAMLHEIGKCMSRVFMEEATKDFEKRGWSQRDPKGGKPLRKSFGYKLKGRSTIEITCSFYGVAHLANEAIPEHPMPWLTQQGKGINPSTYSKVASTAATHSKPGAPKNRKKPLVVPLQTPGGVIFRMAPLTFANAWVHPGIAKFTFAARALKRSREECVRVMRDKVVDVLRSGDPFG